MDQGAPGGGGGSSVYSSIASGFGMILDAWLV